MTASKQGLFMFLMGLAWRCRYSMPLLHITVLTVPRTMTASKRGLFMFLMGLAWRCRYSMPLLLSSTLALLGNAWMFQIRVHTLPRIPESELAYYDDDEYIEEEEDADADDTSWETDTSDSWETIVEEVAVG